MAELKEGQLIFVDENKNEVLCDIIFTYDSEEFKKSYVFFSPVESEDEDGKRSVAVASYTPTDGTIGDLQPVENDEEWDMLEDVLESYVEENDECGCGCGECDCDCEEDDECDCDDKDCCCHHHE